VDPAAQTDTPSWGERNRGPENPHWNVWGASHPRGGEEDYSGGREAGKRRPLSIKKGGRLNEKIHEFVRKGCLMKEGDRFFNPSQKKRGRGPVKQRYDP